LGQSSGIGKSLTKALDGHGAQVVAAVFNVTPLQETVDAINRQGNSVKGQARRDN
jgi:NAD(P)-dependent dehydrogenase (short-subunit alcohol dehydrogenase family)